MATRTSALSPQNEVIDLLARLQILLSALPEPHRGAVHYASGVLENPSMDTRFCEEVGKVVQITARLSQKTDCEIALRGENGPLDWEKNLSPNEPNTISRSNQKTFLFHVPPDQMNETLRFKFIAKTANEAIKWQRGEDCIVDLSQYGHIVIIEIPGVTFPDL